MTEATDLPAPLTPPGCDLKDFAGTMIYRARLRGSSFNATANDAEFRAGLNLWLNAQDQVPAGSLPEADVELCRLADLGRDLKQWRKVKAVALHGWFKCSDGRLYNRVVAEVVNAQWQTKLDQRNRTLKARIAGLGKRLEQITDEAARAEIQDQIDRLQQELAKWQSQTAHGAHAPPVTSPVTDPVTASKRREEKEREEKGFVLVPLLRSGAEAPPPALWGELCAGKPDWWPKRDRYGRVTTEITDKVLFDLGRAVLGQNSGGQISRLKRCYRNDLRACADIVLQADEKSDAREWFAGVLKRAERDEPLVPQHEKFPDCIYREQVGAV